MSAIYNYNTTGGTIRVKRSFSPAEKMSDAILSAILFLANQQDYLTTRAASDIIYPQNVCSPAEKENRQ